MQVKALVAVMLIFMFGHAFGETGRWTGQWVIESSVVEAEVGDPEEASVEGGVPEPDFTLVFAEPPRDLLVDAEALLSPGASVERLEFLRHHADDSEIDLYVYLFGEGARISADTGVERFFAEKKAAVVYYFMGEPQRAGLYLSPPLLDVVSEAEQRRSLQSSVMQAAGNADPEAQLEAFLVQMSIRLYWMERLMDDGVSNTPPVVEHTPPLAPEPKNGLSRFPLPADWLPWIAVGAFLVLALPFVWWVWRVRARYQFPEFKVEPRLGGRHAAGVGAVISYLSPNVPPASQRDQVADHLQRM